MTRYITSRQNGIIKRTVKLASGPYGGEYLCDGTKLLSDALDSGIVPCYVLSAEGTEVPKLPPGTENYILPEALLDYVSVSETPSGIVFVCPVPSCLKGLDPGGYYVLLDRLQDPGNVGAVLRSAGALGFDGALYTEGTANPFGPKAVRAGMGAVFRLPVARISYEELEGLCLPIVGADMSGEDVRNFTPEPCVLAVGNEGSGLSERILRLAEKKISVPMRGGAESLNAACAAAIIMWEIRRI